MFFKYSKCNTANKANSFQTDAVLFEVLIPQCHSVTPENKFNPHTIRSANYRDQKER